MIRAVEAGCAALLFVADKKDQVRSSPGLWLSRHLYGIHADKTPICKQSYIEKNKVEAAALFFLPAVV